jgi:hypothetical protein
MSKNKIMSKKIIWRYDPIKTKSGKPSKAILYGTKSGC